MAIEMKKCLKDMTLLLWKAHQENGLIQMLARKTLDLRSSLLIFSLIALFTLENPTVVVLLTIEMIFLDLKTAVTL